MNFWEAFTNLCNQKGESATTALEHLGLSKGNAARWKAGGGPTFRTAIKIAKYFDVSIDDLIAQKSTTA